MAFIERNQVIEKLDYEPQLNMERAMAPPPKRRTELCRCILGLSRHIRQPSSEQSGGKH
jgi:hypothetical protein